jgi:transposase-like protein
MPRYSEEREAAVLKKLCCRRESRSVLLVASEEGISDVTLSGWLKQCRQQGMPVPASRHTGDEWFPEAKLAVVIALSPGVVWKHPILGNDRTGIAQPWQVAGS